MKVFNKYNILGGFLSFGILINSAVEAQEIKLDDTKLLDTLSIKDSTASIQIDSLNFSISSIDSFDLERKLRQNAKRAGLYSALIPGGGQIYNRDYWKLPIVYGLIGTGAGFAIYNAKELRATKLEVAARLSGNATLNDKFSFLNLTQLQQRQDYFKQNFDMSVLLTSLGYLLQIMEAISANHLKGFDITPDISSTTTPFNSIHTSIGFAININSRK